MATIHSITSTNDMCLKFPPQDDTVKIVGEPKLNSIFTLQQHMLPCANSHPTPLCGANMIFLVLTPSLFSNYTIEDYPTPEADYPNPGDAPDYTTATDSNDQKRIQQQFAADAKKHIECRNMNMALIIRAKSYLDEKYSKKWTRHCLDNGIGQPTYLQFLSWLIDNYGECTAIDRAKNEEKMKTAWDGYDFQDLIDQLNEGQEFATYAGDAFPDKKIVDMAEILIINCKQYGDIMEAWIKDTITNGRTYTNFKTFWESALRIRKMTGTTAGQLGYGMNAEEDTADDAADRELQQSIYNYGAVQRNQSETMANLSNTEVGMSAIDAKVNMLAQQVQMMCQLTASGAAPPPQQQQYYQPIQQQAYQPRNNTRPKGGTRTPRNYGQAGQYIAGNQYQGQGPKPTTNPVKRFNNWNVCDTHGYDIPDDHNGWCCPKPRIGHNPYASREKKDCYNRKAIGKTVLPNQAGRPAYVPRRQRAQQQQQQQPAQQYQQRQQPRQQYQRPQQPPMMPMQQPMQQYVMPQMNMMQQQLPQQVPMQAPMQYAMQQPMQPQTGPYMQNNQQFGGYGAYGGNM